jgi:hypothetical protein
VIGLVMFAASLAEARRQTTAARARLSDAG